MKNDFMMAINQVCHERQLAIDIVLEAVEVALVSAYKRNFSGNHSITAQTDSNSGEPLIFVEKAVVEEVKDPKNEILLTEAKAINPRSEIGGLVSVELRLRPPSRSFCNVFVKLSVTPFTILMPTVRVR